MAETTASQRSESEFPDESNGGSQEWLRFSWPHMYLGALGFAIALYAFLVHRRIEAGQDSGCHFTESLNCDAVLASKYGTLFGIPLGAFGMAYFVVVILTAVTTNRNSTPKQETTTRLLVSAAGVAAVGVLAYVSYTVIKAACPICMATHATILATFAVSLWQYFRVRKPAEPRA
jgi:uncharacterized membrane protein